MTGKIFLLFLLQIWGWVLAQHSPYSLQAAVDALHRREAQLALRDNLEFSRHGEDGGYYWNDAENEVTPYRSNRQELNKLLANYLAREEDRENAEYEPDFDDDDEYGPDAKKRSIFRERDEMPYQTVFRERELDNYNTQPSSADLAQEFLDEIERERNVEREEKYFETLRRLWEKYQQQENDIERELFEEEKKRSGQNDVYFDNKHQGNGGMRSIYWGPEKRFTLPVLPWLPASRKKRFGLTKRSPKVTDEEVNVSGTSEKVAKDLQAIFGQPTEEKKKRSSDYAQLPSGYKDPIMSNQHKNEKTDHNHDHDHEHDHEHDDEDDDDEDDDHKFEHEHDEEEDEDDFDVYEKDKKKKRAIAAKKRSNPEIVKEDQIIPGDLTDFKKKKSVQWSKYFGIDRKKKSDNWLNNKYKSMMKKPLSEEEYPLQYFRNHETSENKQKKQVSEAKLDNMDKKLKNIEQLIIDETVKYTGAHEGISDPEDIRKLKDHVISRLATAYSLEKMRTALEKLKQSVDDDRHLNKNEIEPEDKSVGDDKEKRIAIKKEKAEFDNNNHKIESAAEKIAEEPDNHHEGQQLDDDEKKKKKKRTNMSKYPEVTNDISDFEEELGAGHFEPMNEGLMGGSRHMNMGAADQCPLLDAMEKRCRGIDLLSGDIHQDLLPICGIHQLCYLCGTSQTSCDFQYLSEADSVCGHNTECQSAARSALMILRGTPGPQLGPKECAKNPCLFRAIREIGF